MCPPEIPLDLNYSLAFWDFVLCGFPYLEGQKKGILKEALGLQALGKKHERSALTSCRVGFRSSDFFGAGKNFIFISNV